MREEPGKKTNPLAVEYVSRQNIKYQRCNCGYDDSPKPYRNLIVAAKLCKKGYYIGNSRALAVIAEVQPPGPFPVMRLVRRKVKGALPYIPYTEKGYTG